MREHLGVTLIFDESSPSDSGTMEFVITGHQLMSWLKDKTDILENHQGALPTSGLSEAQAWVLDDRDSFVNAWTTLRRHAVQWKKQDCYFKIGGRLIKKSAADERHGGISGGHAEGYYMSDQVLSGNAPGKDVWKKSDGASYVDFGRSVKDNMSQSVKHTQDVSGQNEWSQAKAVKLRRVLKGDADFSEKNADSTSGMLPMLASVMFVAETARNPRVFPIALMMLDMVGANYSRNSTKYYTLDRILAHPDRIDGKSFPPPGRPQMGPTGRGVEGNTVGYELLPSVKPKQTRRGPQAPTLAMVEGKFSATPQGSARTLDRIDITNDYIQKKEVSILVRWLSMMLQPTGKSCRYLRITALPPGSNGRDLINTSSIMNILPTGIAADEKKAREDLFISLKAELSNKIKGRIDERIGSFDLMPK